MIKDDVIVIKNDKIAEGIYEMALETSVNAIPGQFINIDVNRANLILRRPISISNIEDNKLTIIYRVVGEGTKALKETQIGTKLNILAPLGNGYPLVSGKKVLIIGCGMGVAPMHFLAKALSTNNNVTIILAYSNENLAYLQNDFNNYGNVIITTDDGSMGYKGNVLQYLNENKIDFDTVYACGPHIVLKSIDLKYRGKKEGYLSFEERMACGIGACYGCVVKTKNGFKRVCKDGPIFELGVIDYD